MAAAFSDESPIGGLSSHVYNTHDDDDDDEGTKKFISDIKIYFCELFCGMPLDPIRNGRRYRMGEISSLLFLFPSRNELFIEKQHLRGI